MHVARVVRSERLSRIRGDAAGAMLASLDRSVSARDVQLPALAALRKSVRDGAVTQSARPEHHDSQLTRWSEDWFHVDDRGAVYGLEIGYPHPEPVDREHPNSVQTDGIGPIGGPGAEDTGQRLPRIIARMYGQHGTVGEVQPREDEHLIPDRKITDAIGHRGIERQPSLGTTLHTLLGSASGVDQRRLDDSDRTDLVRHALLPALGPPDALVDLIFIGSR
jgi:hypothetical protein